MAQIKDFVVKQGLIAEGGQQSASTTTGALIVAGGAGIGGNVNIGGSIKRTGNIVGQEHNIGAQLSLRDATFTDSLTSGRTAWGIVNYFGSSILDTVSEDATYTNATSIYIKGAPQAGENLTIEKAWALYATSGSFYIGETAGNTSTAAGQALQVAGGISFGNGIYGTGGGSLFGYFELNESEILTRATQNVGLAEFPDGIRITTSTQAVSTTTGALVVDNNGGVGIGGNLYVGGYIAALTTGTFLGVEQSVSTETGALTVAGGLGVGGRIYATEGRFVSDLASTSSVGGNSLQVLNGGGLGVTGSALIEGQVWVSDTTDSTDLGTGALVVEGGASIGRNLTVNTVNIVDDTEAGDLTTAALTVAGGALIGKNLIVNAEDSSTSTGATNALVVKGGVNIDKDLTVDGAAVIKGDLFLLGQGTQVTINSTNTYIADPVIEIGGGPNGEMLTIPDIYDKGLLIHYQNAVSTETDYRAFIGFENSTERYIFKQNIEPGVGGEDPYGDFYNSGTWSTLEAGSLILRDTTPSEDGVTGALVVLGGAAFGNDSRFLSTVTLTSESFNIEGYENNALQVTDGGIATKWLYVEREAWVDGFRVVTEGTLNAEIGGVFTNTFQFVNLTESTGTDTGAVTVSGGVGIGGNLNVGGAQTLGGQLTIFDATNSVSTDTGALTVVGGVGIGLDVTVGGSVTIESDTEATTSTDGALTVSGGVGIGKNLIVAGDATVEQELSVDTLKVLNETDSTDTVTGAATIAGGLGVAKTINADAINVNIATINSGTNSVDTTTGDLVVSGGVGIGLDVNIGGKVKVYSTETSTTTNSGALAVDGGVGIVKDLLVGGSLVRIGNVTSDISPIGSAGIGLKLPAATYIDPYASGSSAGTVAVHSIAQPTLNGTLNPTWNDAATVYVANSPAFTGGADATRKWALYVADGNVKIAATTANTNGTTNTGALQVAGGVGIGGNLTVGGQAKVSSIKVNDNLITSTQILGKNDDTAVAIDSYVGNEFTTAKYLVQIVDLGTPNKFHVVELMVTYDGSAQNEGVYISQYGIITNQGELGTFDVTYSAGDINVVFTPNYTPVSMNIRSMRMAIITN
jgi:hypothetical protein